jgi:predicted XRE-type DNA-binding protein
MLLRCELAEALLKWMVREGLTQAEAAKRGAPTGSVKDFV